MNTRKTDQNEEIARRYLVSLSFDSVKHEPDGNVSPDFLCDSTIAVEVTKLNQQKDLNGKLVGLEGISFPLRDILRRLQRDMGRTESGSWHLLCIYSRPISNWPNMEKLLRGALEEFKDAPPSPGSATLNIADGLELKMIRSESHGTQFIESIGFNDEDTNGFLFDMLDRSVGVALERKTKALSRLRKRYSECWLVLVDHVGYGLDEFELSLYEDQRERFTHNWDKVVVIDPRGRNPSFEL